MIAYGKWTTLADPYETQIVLAMWRYGDWAVVLVTSSWLADGNAGPACLRKRYRQAPILLRTERDPPG